MPKYSIIVPVYNRPDEVQELLETLEKQTFKDFELVLVEDGSSEPCEEIANQFRDKIDIRYFFKPNSGPGDSRNFGFEKANGDYFLLFDSDCLIPETYMENLDKALAERPLDCFGGPDAGHESFSDIQKAINYSMTSFITTGGIRGGKKQLDKFTPRSFNMGLSREVWEKVGGFCNLHPGEDPDLSFRIMKAGFKTGLIRDTFVYHKRRIDFKKFWKQVYKFGVVRIILSKWHKGTFKAVYGLPTAFLLGNVTLILLGILLQNPLFFIPIDLFFFVVFWDALFKTKSLKIAFIAMFTSFIQLIGYGWGFLKAFVKLNLFGMEEKKAFPDFFFKK